MTLPAKARPGRNEPCHCGSGKKYKHCCLAKDEADASAARAAAAAAQTAEADAATETAPAADAKRPQRAQTPQPWKGTTSRGFVQRSRMPRKAGGS